MSELTLGDTMQMTGMVELAEEQFEKLRLMLQEMYPGKYALIDPFDEGRFVIEDSAEVIETKYASDHSWKDGVIFEICRS